jgi:hypothetical protein
MITFLIIVAALTAYGSGAGFTYALSRDANPDPNSDAPYVAAGLWPVCLPAILVARVTENKLDAIEERKALPPARVVNGGDR